LLRSNFSLSFFFQAEDGIRDFHVTGVQTCALPIWAVRSIGVFVPFLGATVEMMYQWEVPYLMDDGDFRRTFAVGPTPLPAAIERSEERRVGKEGRSWRSPTLSNARSGRS